MNWKNLISDLTAAGVKQKDIAAEIGSSPSYISNLAAGARGVRVSYELGKALVDLHAAKVGHKPSATD